MEGKSVGRFTLGRQSSLMPDRDEDQERQGEEDIKDLDDGDEPEIPDNIRLMYMANEGNVEGIKELLDCGTDVNFQDIDGRTALHVAACQGCADVVELILENGAKVDPTDRWGSTQVNSHQYELREWPLALDFHIKDIIIIKTLGHPPQEPLADAIHYKNSEVIKLLEKYGAKIQMVPMLVKDARQVPEYEIDPKELDFSDSVQITKGTFSSASWRGIQVAVKTLGDDFIADEDKVRAFRDELALLQQIRHPNVVQFLGAVTQNAPMMIVTEYLPKGDLRDHLKKKGALKPAIAVKYALDIARGMNYLHEHKPEAIIHRDLEPSNILRDDSGHLKVADFGVSKFLKRTKTAKEDKPLTCEDTSCRYAAPEVFLNGEYDTKVDVFSFSLILQEMIEGCPPFSSRKENDVPKSYAQKERPSFRVPLKLYSHGIKELIEECWSEKPANRPTFREIIQRLQSIQNNLARKRRWKVRPLKCFQNLEAIWKRENPDPSSRSSRSSHPSI